ncbi:hypothetical protein IAU60_002110 [Kwoniella sp. DSM 27419]
MQSPNASTRFTLLPTDYLSSQPPSSEVTLQSLIDTSDRLAEEAKEALPYSFDECTYEKGHLRQAVWSCLDCGEKGVCYGCSISCHADHRLVELWTRRHFRCDCPTASTQPEPAPPAKRRRCNLNPPEKQPQEPNEENKYMQNFQGKFCRCGRDYNPETETEAMLCCIGCEDWFHESCLNLRAPPGIEPSNPVESDTPQLSDKPPAPAAASVATGASDTQAIASASAQEEEDGEEDDDEAVLIPSESYDGLICGACVKGNRYLRSMAGKTGWMIIEPVAAQEAGDATGSVRVIGRRKSPAVEPAALPDHADTNGNKRVLEDDTSDGSAAKKVKLEGPQEELASGEAQPTPSSGAIAQNDANGSSPNRRDVNALETSDWPWRGKGDVFLAHGVREDLKGKLDEKTISSLPFPVEDEEIYEPPQEEDDAEETIDQVTSRVMDQLPRAQAIEALHGYQRLKDRLNDMLRTHVQSGRTVSKEDIEGLFEQLRRGAGR